MIIFLTPSPSPRPTLSHTDIAKGSMMTPPDNCDPLDSVNAMLKSNIRQQRLLTQSLRQPGLNKKKLRRNPFRSVEILRI